MMMMIIVICHGLLTNSVEVSKWFHVHTSMC